MTDMMVQDPPTEEQDELRLPGDGVVSIGEEDDLRSLADDTSGEAVVTEDTVNSHRPEDEAPVAQVSQPDPAPEAEVAGDTMEEPAQETVGDEATASLIESTPAPSVADSSELESTEVEIASKTRDSQETPAAPPAPPKTDAPTETSITPPPAPPKADMPAEKTPVSPAIATSDEYNPTLALRLFNLVRDGFIRVFDVLLTGFAIVLEFIAGLDWEGYREAIGKIHRLLPEKYRKVIYGGLVLVIVLVVMTGSVLVAFSGEGAPVVIRNSQIIPVSQTQNQTADNGILSPVFTPTVQQWAGQIAIWTDNVPEVSPDQLAIVMQFESCGNLAVGSGLFGQETGASTLGDADAQAQMALSRLQAALASSNGNFPLALAVYADGERVMQADFAEWTLVARDMFILGRNIEQQIARGATTSPDLNSWLQSTGSLLCAEGHSMRGD